MAAAAVPPDSVIRQLTVEEGGGAVGHAGGSVPGYAAVTACWMGSFTVLSGGTVGRPG
jgi:hypothetical protein